MPEELKQLLERAKSKEKAAEDIIEQAQKESSTIVDSAYQQKQEIFSRVKQEYQKQFEQWKDAAQAEYAKEKQEMIRTTEGCLSNIKKTEADSIDKISVVLIETIKSYGHRKG